MKAENIVARTRITVSVADKELRLHFLKTLDAQPPGPLQVEFGVSATAGSSRIAGERGLQIGRQYCLPGWSPVDTDATTQDAINTRGFAVVSALCVHLEIEI